MFCQITVQLVKNNPFYQFGDSWQCIKYRSVVIRNAFLAIFVLIGVTLAIFHSLGKMPLLIEILNKLARDGAIMESTL